MNTDTHINRYGDRIVFEEIDATHIRMTGGEYTRTGYDEDGKINMVDPSGGPFTQIGMKVMGKTVVGISWDPDTDEDQTVIFDVKG